MATTTVSWVRDRAALAFGAAAALLVPWIVLLAVTQRSRGVADQVVPLRLTFASVIAVLSVAAVVRASSRPRQACMAASGAAAFALSGAWFDVVTRLGLPSFRLVTRLGIYCALTMVADVLLALTCLAPRRRTVALARAFVLLALGALLLQSTSTVTSHVTTLPVTHVGTAWVGLDVFEAVALAGLARSLAVRSALVHLAGPAAAALLSSDALINILTSGGLWSTAAASAMAVVELGLGWAAVSVAREFGR